jgi:hypothetical protein
LGPKKYSVVVNPYGKRVLGPDNLLGPDRARRYTPTLPSRWLRREGGVLEAVMVHSGWWDDYNFAAVPLSFDILPAV